MHVKSVPPEIKYSLEGKKIWVAGHLGMVGSALLKRLERENCRILTVDRQEVDLCRQEQVENWMRTARPDAVFVAAAKVGGILANNTFPASFIYENLMIATSIIHASKLYGVEKLLFLGSSCIYPKMAPQPIPEHSLLSGPLEPTNEHYAIAKIAGIKLCEAFRRQYGCDFISAMLTNLYGPGDNFNPDTSHVVPAIIRKVQVAMCQVHEQIEIWGTGTPKREFMHVKDAADALVFLMKHYSAEEHINVGSGHEVSIRELAEHLCRIAGYTGQIACDTSKPDGTPRKLMDSGKLCGLGWQPEISLEEGLRQTYDWFLEEMI